MRTVRTGFMLLEIVVAVGLLVLGLAVIGAQIQDAAMLSREGGETEQLARVTAALSAPRQSHSLF